MTSPPRIMRRRTAPRQIEIDSAVKAEVEAITKWLKAHGMRQVANGIERGEYK